MTGNVALAARSKAFFGRSGRKIGLQLYTLGDEAGKDLDATLARVAEIGYRDIELPGLYGKKAADIAAAAKRAGVSISSIHLAGNPIPGMWSGLTLASPPAEIADTLGTLGARKAVMPIMMFPENFRPNGMESFAADLATALRDAGEDIWKRTSALLNERGSGLKSTGIRVGYHNHNTEFLPIGTTTGWEILMRETDPRLVDLEVDIGWIATAGLDPVKFLKGLRGRVTQMHVKDVGAGNVPNHALKMVPAEVGSGTLDWARILPAAYNAGVRHFYVEQEPPFAIPRIEAAQRSHAYLSKLKA